jgi:sugar (pentulose or hexulose) kinase
VKYLALDFGTSFLKGAVLDIDQAEITHASRTSFPPPLPGLPPRHVEVDPAAIVQAAQELLAQLAEAAPDAVGVVVCSQMHGLVLMDAEGKAISNAVTWQDQRILDASKAQRCNSCVLTRLRVSNAGGIRACRRADNGCINGHVGLGF